MDVSLERAPRCREHFAMRSVIDWLSQLYGPERNPYLRLSQADRDKVGARFGMLLVVVAIVFAMWWFLR